MSQPYESRDPVHGFVTFSAWERDIINHEVFQRLRRIRQLAWTEMVYPGAVHTRFEHSLGVMHTATRMFRQLADNSARLLGDLGISKDTGLDRDLQMVRLAALLHDVGHSPFSHAGEDLMPLDPATSKPFKHEQYSAALIRTLLRDVIDDHPGNQSFDIRADDVADLIEGSTRLKQRRLFWRQLITSQLDADRADYLLRDSHHLGVNYGRYDLERVIVTLTAVRDPQTDDPILAIREGGWHAAEALVWARYQMFTQVYFHKTRVAYDHHVARTMSHILASTAPDQGGSAEGRFPPPTDEASLRQYLAWTDWRVLGLLESGAGGEHGEILRRRRHYRRVYETPEVPDEGDVDTLERVTEALGELLVHVGRPETSWYKNIGEIQIEQSTGEGPATKPLSSFSRPIRLLGKLNRQYLYVAQEHADEARARVRQILSESRPGRES
jgi:HD superfamily phosphohydrolase